MKVVIKVNQLESVLRTAPILGEPVRASVKLRLQKIYKAVSEKYEANGKIFNGLIAKYCDPIPLEEGASPEKQSFKIREDVKQEYEDKVKELNESEVEFDLQPIDMDMLCTDAAGVDIVFKGNYNLLILEEYFSEKK